MSTEQNKAVVRRFMTEVLHQGGNLDILDEVLAPTSVNPATGGADGTGFRAILTGMAAAGIGLHFSNIGLIADEDDVVARFTLEVTRPGQEKLAAQGLTYYHLADGRVVEDDPYSTPDLAHLLGHSSRRDRNSRPPSGSGRGLCRVAAVWAGLCAVRKERGNRMADYPDIYADGFSLTAGPFGVTLTLTRSDPTLEPGPHQDVSEIVARVRLSQPLARAIVEGFTQVSAAAAGAQIRTVSDKKN